MDLKDFWIENQGFQILKMNEYNGRNSLDNICLISSWGWVGNCSHRMGWCHGVGSGAMSLLGKEAATVPIKV